MLERVRITEGESGYRGKAEATIEDCVVDFPEPTVLQSTCQGSETTVSGKVRFSATTCLRGRLTGNLDTPVVPLDDHLAEIHILRIEADNFTVESTGNLLTPERGPLAGILKPRTARDIELGACDNLLDGTIRLTGETHTRPTNPQDDGLDPKYGCKASDTAWQCGDVEPDTPFECHFVDPLAQGTSQLTAFLLRTLANALEEDTACSFSSDTVRCSPQLTGTLGEPGGSGVFSISSPCTLTFKKSTALRENCRGKKTFARSTVHLTGTKTLRGYNSGDTVEPAVPASVSRLGVLIDPSRVVGSPGQRGRME